MSGTDGLGPMERGKSAWLNQAAFRRRARACRLVAALAAAAALTGCASISQKFADVASQMPGIGLSANAPERPAEPAAYPAVHDIPPPRNSVVLTNFEQQKLEDDLVAARDKQQSSAGIPLQTKNKPKSEAKSETKNSARRTPPQQAVVPASSNASIY